MKIHFLTTAHNSLSQRAFVELVDRGHTVVVVIASSEEGMLEAVEREHPDLIVAPLLKKVIPASIWQQHTCLIIYPGIKGDRGPSSLDWAILNGFQEWGVTLLQADAEMDAGDIWAWRPFAMRDVSKSHLYRHEVTEAAIQALLETIAKVESHTFVPEPLDYSRQDVKGRWQSPMKQADRAIDWTDVLATYDIRRANCLFPSSIARLFTTDLLIGRGLGGVCSGHSRQKLSDSDTNRSPLSRKTSRNGLLDHNGTTRVAPYVPCASLRPSDLPL